MTVQMDLLDLLVEPQALDRDTDVLGSYLTPWRLHQIVRALDDPVRLKQVRLEMVQGQAGGAGLDFRWNTEADGLHVSRWYAEPVPFVITWRTAGTLIRERATPDRAEALRLARAANPDAPGAFAAEYAAANAILPHRRYLRWGR